MTRAVTLSYEDAVLVAELVRGWDDLDLGDARPAVAEAVSRLADALDEAEAREPSGLFPEPYIVGPSGLRYRVRSRAEEVHD